MSDEPRISRRRVLAAGVSGVLTGLAGCTSEQLVADDGSGTEVGQTDDQAADSPPVVDNGSDDASQNVVVDVAVVDENGDPLSGVEVELEDRGGTPDDRYGETGEQGRLRFVESVGPPPCNRQTLLLPEHDLKAELGCHDGGAELQHTFEVETSRATPDEAVDYPVVDNGSGDPDQNVVVDVTVVDESGEPVPDAAVELEDRGGTPDDRYGETGEQGRLRFVESVGPPPCNRQTLVLVDEGQTVDLGCNDGGVELQHTFEVAREEPTPRSDVDYPVVDNGNSDPEKNVVVDVAVVDENGDSLPDAAVELEDRGGTPDDRFGETGEQGRLRFVEDVGPAPCNTQTLVLAEHGQEVELGCHNGGVALQHTFEVTRGESTPGGDVDYPVVDNGSSDASRNVVVDVTAVDEDGEPVSGVEVELEDRGGTPDDRYGETGEGGRLRFVENVGPPPCNRQTLIVAADDHQVELGCHNGGVELSERITVDR